MSARRSDSELIDPSGRTTLYRAAENGDEGVVHSVLASARSKQGILNLAEKEHGWTPLFIACVNGHLPIVRLLLEQGAEQRLCDLSGWTETEHAAFRGHMKVAEALVAHEAYRKSQVESDGKRASGPVRPGDPLKCTIQSHMRKAARLEPRNVISNRCQKQQNIKHLFLTLGPSNTRSNLRPVELSDQSSYHQTSGTELCVTIKAGSTEGIFTHSIELPMEKSMINDPLQVSIDDPENVALTFEIYNKSKTGDKGVEVIGTGLALPKYLQHGFAPGRESLVRDYTIPILDISSMMHIGCVTFNILVITPFQSPTVPSRPSLGFWKQDEPVSIVGHRGSGANSTLPTNLQIGENTVQSFLTATDLGASCVEFDVQLTKDYRPVIFHDFLVLEMGGDVPLDTLTFDQFMHLSRSQAPRSDLLSRGEVRYLDKNGGDLGTRPRSHSVNVYDDCRSRDLFERMKYTEEGIHNNIKGNIRGRSIQEPSSTLEQLLTKLPESVAFNLEIKYPMLWEAQDRGMEYGAIELNFFVDTILTTIFRFCGNRNITLSSFCPEVCIALVCKQETFPILFINKAGSVPTGDVRAGSLQGAIEFAKSWNLAGIVMLSDPFVLCPRLLTYAKDSGLVVGSYGNLNDEKESALVQAEAGLDAIITNKIRLISETLAEKRP